MKTYFVSNLGDGNNDGISVNTTWKTLAQAPSATYHPGDQLLLDDERVWSEPLLLCGNDSPDGPILVTGYGTGRPRTRWDQDAVIELANRSHRTIRGVDVYATSHDTLCPALREVDNPAGVTTVPKWARQGINTGFLATFEGVENFACICIKANCIFGSRGGQDSQGILVVAHPPPKARQPKLRHLFIRNSQIQQVGWGGIGTEGPRQSFDPQNIPWMAFEDVTFEGNIVRQIGVQAIYVFNPHQVAMRRNLVGQAGIVHGVGVSRKLEGRQD